MLRYAIAAVIAATASGAGLPQTPSPCDPNAAPSSEQAARRRLAITAARQINTAEARTSAANGRYAPLKELTGVSIPEGFDVQVSTDGSTYTFSVKDLQDECKFAVFSDQKGLIYTAAPLQ